MAGNGGSVEEDAAGRSWAGSVEAGADLLTDTGISASALLRYVEGEIYSLPQAFDVRNTLTVLLTGSRATGTYNPTSDVDVDVLCPREVWERLHRAALDAGIVKTPKSFFCVLEGGDWSRYFGPVVGRPHFSVTAFEDVEEQFRQYDDVACWIWTNAKILTDLEGRFRRLLNGFRGYPRDVLITKLKYRWLRVAHWIVDGYPYHHSGPGDALAGATAALNAVNDLLRVFFLVEGQPFPYPSKLMAVAVRTPVGREFIGLLQGIVDRVTGTEPYQGQVLGRLDQAVEILSGDDEATGFPELERACEAAMIERGVERRWLDSGYRNIDELLSGALGPIP